MHAIYTSCYICHDKMHEMNKGKLYICYKGAPTHRLQKSNKDQDPSANESKFLDLGVW
jgi:hypothetical protein